MTRRHIDTAPAVELPFGTYKGWLLVDVPGDYLKWLLEGNTLRSEALRRAVYAEWSWRQHQASRREVTPESPRPGRGRGWRRR